MIASFFTENEMPPLKNPCAICQCREADKKNSHIVPLCIIKNLVAIDGEKKVRDRELSFSISSHELNTAYVGRDILPEKVGELFGDEIANKVSTEGKNQFAQDYFLCTSCENKLGDLESELTKSFLDPINKFRQGNATEIRFEKNNDTIRLFFMSIIFRMSVTRFGGFSLPFTFEENVRAILNKELNGAQETPTRAWFPLQIYVVEPRENDTKNIVVNIPSIANPYYLFLNHFILFYYYKEKTLKETPVSFWELEKYLVTEILKDSKAIVIRKMKEAEYAERTDKIMRSIAGNTNERINYYFTECHKMVTGKYPLPQLTQEFFNHLHNKKEALGKYTISGLAVVIHDFLKLKLAPPVTTPVKTTTNGN